MALASTQTSLSTLVWLDCCLENYSFCDWRCAAGRDGHRRPSSDICILGASESKGVASQGPGCQWKAQSAPTLSYNNLWSLSGFLLVTFLVHLPVDVLSSTFAIVCTHAFLVFGSHASNSLYLPVYDNRYSMKFGIQIIALLVIWFFVCCLAVRSAFFGDSTSQWHIPLF